MNCATVCRTGCCFWAVLDIAIALFDIAITALVVYFILLLLRDSRAWQLLRGIILIIAFACI